MNPRTLLVFVEVFKLHTDFWFHSVVSADVPHASEACMENRKNKIRVEIDFFLWSQNECLITGSPATFQ